MKLPDGSERSLGGNSQVTEYTWANLKDRLDTLDVPESHKAILDGRRKRVETGEAKLVEWDAVKHTIGQRK